MKNPILISSIIHGAVFAGISVAIFYQPAHPLLNKSSNELTGIEMISTSVSTQKSAHVSPAKDAVSESRVQNLNSIGVESQESAPSSYEKTYVSELQKKIQAEERYPKDAQKRGFEELIYVQFHLSENGEITQISLFSKPKYEILGDAALNAVKAASPFFAPPAGISRDFRIPIDFKIK